MKNLLEGQPVHRNASMNLQHKEYSYVNLGSVLKISESWHFNETYQTIFKPNCVYNMMKLQNIVIYMKCMFNVLISRHD